MTEVKEHITDPIKAKAGYDAAKPLVLQALEASGMGKEQFLTLVLSVLLPGENPERADTIVGTLLDYYSDLNENQGICCKHQTLVDVLVMSQWINQQREQAMEAAEALHDLMPEGSA